MELSQIKANTEKYSKKCKSLSGIPCMVLNAPQFSLYKLPLLMFPLTKYALSYTSFRSNSIASSFEAPLSSSVSPVSFLKFRPTTFEITSVNLQITFAPSLLWFCLCSAWHWSLHRLFKKIVRFTSHCRFHRFHLLHEGGDGTEATIRYVFLMDITSSMYM